MILYELLTGTTPIARDTFKNAALDEIFRLIREVEPQTPSSRISTSDIRANIAAIRQTEPAKLGRYVRGDLDWIVMTLLGLLAARLDKASGEIEGEAIGDPLAVARMQQTLGASQEGVGFPETARGLAR